MSNKDERYNSPIQRQAREGSRFAPLFKWNKERFYQDRERILAECKLNKKEAV